MKIKQPELTNNSRRKFLKNMAKAGLLLPFASQMMGQNAFAQVGGASRLLILYYPNGAHTESWYPANNQVGQINQSTELSFGLAPLAPWHDNIIVLRNLFLDGTGDGAHLGPMRGLLGMNQELPVDQHTVDHMIAEALSSEVYSVGVRTSTDSEAMISKPRGRSSRNRPVPNNDPADAASKLSALIGDGGEVSDLKRRMYETLINDFDDLANISLEATRENKVTEHLDSLTRLRDQAGVVIGECGFVASTRSDPFKEGGNAAESEAMRIIPDLCRAQLDNAIGALTCGLNRVATVQLFKGDEHESFAHYGFDECWALSELASQQLQQHNHPRFWSQHASHFASHLPQDAGHAGQTRWYHTLLAYTLEQLQSKGVLNDTLVVMLSEVGDGAKHGGAAGCVTVAGGAGNSLNMGRIIDCGNGINGGGNVRRFGTRELFGDLASLMGVRLTEGGWTGGVIL